MKYCKKCGWKMDYKPRSHQEHIREIIGEQDKKGFWKCPNCGFTKYSKNMKSVTNGKSRKKDRDANS